MINLIITQFFRRRHLAWAMSVALVLFGAWSWTQMTVEAYPDLGDVNVQVTTQVNGLAAEEIEQQITTPLERALSNTPGLASIRSSSTFGLSLITLTFKDGTDDYFARQRVTERIGQVSLPSGAQPGLGPVAGPAGEIYRYTLESDTKNLMELSELQRWKVIPALKQVAGVVDINNFGGFTKEFQLELDPARLQKYGLVLGDVVTAINNNSANAGGGRIARGDTDIDTLIAVTIADLPREQRDRIVVHRHTATRTALMDMSLLRLALRNLLSNALKYAPGLSPVTLHVMDFDEPAALQFEVADAGPGIPRELLPRLFTRGARGDGGSGGHEAAHGLGLYIVRRVMDMHGGSAELLRTGPLGTVMRLTLPQAG
ncbi:MAG: efflux RND transporter permease subunit [Roseateles sp.]|uniref:efflux RND transporter permease subunit n=1 Tax=Roseateles sp. TaxID=1971397 RepID=UPI004036240B